MRDFVRLWINGREVAARGACALMTLSDFLRRELRLTGTKVVCAEGDCGSCSVLVGHAAEGRIDYRTVCGCIATVGQLDGAHVVTVEGLSPRGELNCVQKAFCEGHGAQCGFCTPGFVVALQGAAERGVAWEREPLRRELVGNLCRCTGYESILDSAVAADVAKLTRLEQLYPAAGIATAMAQAAQEEMRVADAGETGGMVSAGPVGRVVGRSGEASCEAPCEVSGGVVGEASGGAAGGVAVVAGTRVIYKPVTLSQAVAFRAEHPSCVVLSGGTDLGVAVNKRKMSLAVVMTLGGIAELRRIGVMEGILEIGGGATVAELEAWAGGGGGRGVPALAEYLQWFASPPVKAAASVAGNVVTGSPIGDLLPPLLALGARVKLASVAGEREVPLDGFYTGYRKSVLRADELVSGLRVPLPGEGERLWFYKVSRRKDLDISAVSCAIKLGREPRVAFGGVAATPVRLKGAEAVLARDGGSAESLKAAAEVAMNEVTPLSDHRGSAGYRKLLVRNVLIKAAGELFGAAEGGPA